MQIFDNVGQRLGEDIRENLRQGSRLSIAAACFSIYAFEELKEELEKIEELRFIFTSPSFAKAKPAKVEAEAELIRFRSERSLYGTEFESRLRNTLTQKAIAKECADWIRKKARFKANISGRPIQGSLVLDEAGYTPLSCFSTVDLGSGPRNSLNTNVVKDEGLAGSLLADFDEIWEDEELLEDVTEEVLESIRLAYDENSPDFIYFFTLYNIFSEFLEEVSEDELPREDTGFRESSIWNKLYPFQKDAALSIINKLEKYNGCILADSVGLGKTYTALAVMKYYETRNKSVLVLCPKKISHNWNTYKQQYKNNPLAADKLRYDVLYHTDLSRLKGLSNGIDLARLNWGGYDLVVIDESHNFRNGGKLLSEDKSDKENRYDRLLRKVIREGVKTKVLMLSATPVNNKFLDLKHQLALSYEGRSEVLDKKLQTTHSIDEIFRSAERAFQNWSKLEAEERRVDVLLDMLDFDFFELLDSVTIARSRRHIQKYYDTSQIGPFSKRLRPLSLYPRLSDIQSAMDYNEIYAQLMQLHLSVYMPSHYILPDRVKKYTDFSDYEGLSAGINQLSRERGLRRLMAMNLLKRLESSVHAFKLTLGRIKKLIDDTLRSVEVLGRQSSLDLDFKRLFDSDELDADDMGFDEAFSAFSQYKIAFEDMDFLKWKESLLHDADILERLRLMVDNISPSHDMKLDALFKLASKKVEEPINEGNKKILVFTAYADTALYIYEHFSKYMRDKYGLHSALVTGSVDGLTTCSRSKQDLNSVLCHFSPLSKEKALIMPSDETEIDILIATDCISEGQNLQDCDFLINYDIHWNPVRIIQRFGRIDRIGSKNKYIQLVNFWPDVSLDDYIGLKAKVEAKMSIVNVAANGDEDLLGRDEKIELEFRRRQLERLKEEVVDMEDMGSSVSIMDLGFNEYRMDLLEYRKLYKNAAIMPHGIHALAPAGTYSSQGVIFVLRNRSEERKASSNNMIYPYYLVYVDKRGEIVLSHSSPRRVLEKMRQLCKGRTEALSPLYTHFNEQTENCSKMKFFSNLLGRAVSSTLDEGWAEPPLMPLKEAPQEPPLKSLEESLQEPLDPSLAKSFEKMLGKALDEDGPGAFDEAALSKLADALNFLDSFELLCFLIIL